MYVRIKTNISIMHHQVQKVLYIVERKKKVNNVQEIKKIDLEIH